MRIKESAENYLEAILMLQKQKGYVRSVDVANYLGFSKPSVSIAMKSFRTDGYVDVDSDGIITLSEKGMEIATRMCERHEIIARALISLGVSEATAYEDSCKIEHDISNESFEKIKSFLEKSAQNN